MSVLEEIRSRAHRRKRRIVLPEGEDERVIAASAKAQADGLATITLLGNEQSIRDKLAKSRHDTKGLTIIDPSMVETDYLVNEFLSLQTQRRTREEDARLLVREPLNYAAMMVRMGEADGTVGGAVSTTADTVRAAGSIIGKRAGCKTISSFFLMICEAEHFEKKGAFIFADCAKTVEPTSEILANTAILAAEVARQFLNEEPRIAMLSFSTAGSASHPKVTKVQDATEMVKRDAPDLTVYGDLQFDSAFVPMVAAKKAPDSPIQGDANVFIFPSLEAGNIGYKIAERIGGAVAIGPVLMGLAKPANDLSRGCSEQDVYDMIAITAAQVQD